jgi:hypothetical protein
VSTQIAQRFLDRFLPAEERADALWIAGAAAGLWVVKALTYQQLLGFTMRFVASPRIEELGFPLRATAIADVAWAVVAGLIVWALLRFTPAPKALALFILFAGVLGGLVNAGSRAALDVVELLASIGYQRTIWSDLQPLMLTLAEAVGVVLGAWIAHLSSRPEASDGGTLLPALGLDARPLAPATRMAIVFAGVVSLSQLITATVQFVPMARAVVLLARGVDPNGWLPQALGLPVGLLMMAAPVFVAYWAVKRLGASRSLWIAFPATTIAQLIAILRIMPDMIERASSGAADVSWLQLGSVVVAFMLATLLPLLGVGLATRTSPPSATLPAEENYDAVSGGTDG